ncbi:MAG: response regulator [Bacteroidetes bacterium]|nr:response regulator [Bacteroidota bacterium]
MKPEDKPNILIVDDIEPNVILLETTLRHLNANIIRAFSAKEALEKIRGKELALALIDVNMPEMSGIELVSRILRDKGRNLVPIIFITAYPCKESELEKIYETGIIDYIFKPIEPRLLISKVKIFLELNRQKRKVLSSEKLYRMLLNASPEGIIIMDTSGAIREISNVASGIFKLSSREDYTGTNIITLFPPDEHARLQEVIKSTMEQGHVLNVVFLITCSDQTRLESEISFKLIRDSNEKPRALMAVIRDISQRRMIQQQMINDERLESIEEIATGISCELNQPLRLISLGLENLLVEISKNKSVDPEYFHNKAKQIFNSIARITYVIDHIKIFSSVNRNLTFIEFDIHNAIRNSISMIENQFANAGILLTTNFDKNIQVISGDPEKFEQVILNLLLNSQDAIEEKMRIVKTEFKWLVDLKTYRNKTHIKIEVMDNGMGFKSADLDKIMLPFHTTKKAEKYTGLGLSISFAIIKEMNGIIDIESEYSRWTRIRITLPRECKA